MKSVAVQLVNTANAVKSSATLAQRQAELKTQFTTIRSAEGSLKTSVPGTLKTKLNTVLAFVNLVSALVYVFTLPFVAVVTTYLYFDLVVRERLAPEREPAAQVLPAEI